MQDDKQPAMGYYVRKSLKAGPFRVSLSKSGVGVSTGVPGFRVGSGPRGNYVRAGKHGVYYRATLPSGRRPTTAATRSTPPTGALPTPSSVVATHDITGASALELAPSSADDLVGQLNAAASVRSWWPVLLLIPVFGWIAAVWLRLSHHARRSVVVFYDVNDEHDAWYEQLTTCGRHVVALPQCGESPLSVRLAQCMNRRSTPAPGTC
jgi:DNA polymerase-3 subunit epsilon